MTVQIFFNLQNHPIFHWQERLVILVRGRECFIGLYLSIVFVYGVQAMSLICAMAAFYVPATVMCGLYLRYDNSSQQFILWIIYSISVWRIRTFFYRLDPRYDFSNVRDRLTYCVILNKYFPNFSPFRKANLYRKNTNFRENWVTFVSWILKRRVRFRSF